MKVGDRMPEVLGLNEKGEEVTMAQFKGRKVIVYAYPKDNTSGCTAEACSLKEHYADLQAAGYDARTLLPATRSLLRSMTFRSH